MVTESTIEENMLGTLSAKHELFQAVLDPDSRIDQVEMQSGVEELKRRLEVLIGRRPEAAIDASEAQRVSEDAGRLEEERLRVAAAGGKMLAAAFEFLGELLPARGGVDAADSNGPDASNRVADELRSRLDRCIQQDEDGRLQLAVTLPGRESLDKLARSLALLLAR